MKLNHALVLTAALLITPLLRAGDLPAPLPEFMDQGQMAKWTAAQEAAAPTTATAPEPSTQFYTGKPYVADAGGYVYKYRTYNPEMSRWTTADPSGFPDGVNNVIYAPNPTYQVDDNGLSTITVNLGQYKVSFGSDGGSVTKNDIGPTWTSNEPGLVVTYSISGTLTVTSGAIPGGSLAITLGTSANSPAPGADYTSHLDMTIACSSKGAVSYGFEINWTE